MKIIAVGMNYALHNKELGHTLVNKEPVSFMISLIPHTGSLTVLSTKRIGEPVNIECDYLGKYIEQLMQKEHEGVTTKRLKDLGYGGHYGI